MYNPRAFRVDDRAALLDFVRRYNFATVISSGDEGLSVSHLPLLLQVGNGDALTLQGHMARANPQWRDFEAGSEVLALFKGPHAYVSPSLYEEHPSVPTWNYMVVHARGTPRLLLDDAAKRKALSALVDQHEAGAVNPWRLDLPEDYFQRMLDQIVAFEVDVTAIEGKFKLSQNRGERDRRNVAESFAASEDSALRELGRAMREVGAP